MSRRNLVIVRAGNKSLHPNWLAGETPRNWDLVVNYFGDDPDIYRAEDIRRIDSKGPKWPPLQALIEGNPQFLDDYDYVWFPDDDLEMAKADMNRFFDICKQNSLELAQPSLTARSPVTHPLVLNNSWSKVRFTNFVEVMAPCFSAPCLRRLVGTFGETRSGWGIDWLWPRLVPNPGSGIAIVDDVVIHHTRPLGGPNYDAMRAAGLSPREELESFVDSHGIKKTQIEIHRVVLKSGKVKEIKRLTPFFAAFLILGYARALIGSQARWPLLIQIAKLLKSPFR